MEYIPGFLTPTRIYNYVEKVLTDPWHFYGIFFVNAPLIYSIYNNTFTFNAFCYSYLLCGVGQGVINNYLYILSDYAFHEKPPNLQAWLKLPISKQVILLSDATYLYAIGSMVYMSSVTIPEPYRWNYTYPGIYSIMQQLFMIMIIHDFVFYGIHYIVHKIPYLRHSHMKLHHECPFEIGGGRCILAANESEGFVRDLFSAIVSTYFVNFYGHAWMLYYTCYSLWAMYIHTGANKYHLLHHSNRPMRNYGLYYLSDYVFNTLDYTEDFKTEKTDFKTEKTDFKTEKTDFKTEKTEDDKIETIEHDKTD